MRADSYVGIFLLTVCAASWNAPAHAQLETPPTISENNSAESESSKGKVADKTNNGSGLVGQSAVRPKLPASSAVVEEVGPKIYWIPDETGRLRAALLNEMTFEEFKDLIGKLAVQREQIPQYSLNTLTITGLAKAESVDLSIEVAIENRHDSKNAWIRVPLKMADIILPIKDSVSYEGPGEHLVQYDDALPGYVVWLRGGTGEQHLLSLNARVPIQKLANENRLRLNLPRATKSDFTLQVPNENIETTVTAGGHLRESTGSGGKTKVVIDGVAGDLRLSWRGERGIKTQVQSLDVEGRQKIQIEGALVRNEVDLTVQSLSGPFDYFRVQLPVDARLISEGNTGSYALQIDDTTDDKTADAGPWVNVKLERPTKGPIDIHLVTQQISDLDHPEHALQLAGFAVEDANLQSGQIDVQVKRDWSIEWLETFENRFDIRRVDAADADVAARFEYYRQPYSLKVKVAPPTSEVTVKPEYVIDVTADRMEMELTLLYQVRGASISDDIVIDMLGWEPLPASENSTEPIGIGRIGPVDNEGRVKIDLSGSRQGEFAIVIRAQRTIDPKAKLLKLPLPRPLGENLGASQVIVSAADNVELTPNESSNLQTEWPLGMPAKLARRQQKPLHYLFDRGEDMPLELTTDFQIHPLTITSKVYSKIELARRSRIVTQSLVFDIAHQRINSLTLLVPRELLTQEDFMIKRDNLSLNWEVIAAPADQSVLEVRVPLKNDIGHVHVTARHLDTSFRITSKVDEPIEIPLVMPGQGKQIVNVLGVKATADIEARPINEDWNPLDAADAPHVPTLEDWQESDHYESEQSDFQVLLRAKLTERPAEGILVKRAWIQTWLTSNQRYDLVVCRFESRQDYCDFQLPESAEISAVDVLLDGQPLQPQRSIDGKLRIGLDDESFEHTIELRYSLSRKSEQWGEVDLELPGFPAAELQQPIYWQLVLPLQQHLVSGPSNSLPWYAWKWQRFGWHRVSLTNETKLARWSGMSGSDQATNGSFSSGANDYLFRLPDWPDHVVVETLPRTLLVLIPAGLVLAIGTALVYFPFLRRAEILLCLAVGIAAVGWIFPEPGVIMAQMAILGGVLALLAVFLKRILNARGPQHVLVRNTSGSSIGTIHSDVIGQPSSEMVMASTIATPHPPRITPLGGTAPDT
ncbi:MAG: hypothetical protein N2C12_12790, partial [Planctomycetales bacterium]